MSDSNGETWKPVVGAEVRYQVSDRGNVMSLPHTVITSDGRVWPVKGQALKPIIHPLKSIIHPIHGRKKPYRFVWIRFDGRRRLVKICVLMLEAFVEPRPYPAARSRHLNDESLDDRLENLAWGSSSDDRKDMVRNGHHPRQRGSNHGGAVLTEADVLSIRAAYAAGGVTYHELAEQYGMHRGTVGNIVRGKTWRHVQVVDLAGKGTLAAKVVLPR